MKNLLIFICFALFGVTTTQAQISEAKFEAYFKENNLVITRETHPINIANGYTGKPFTCTIKSITDGDTFNCMRGDKLVKVRIKGIDSPEINQKYGVQSKKTLERVAQVGGTAYIYSHKKDQYGRVLGDVFVYNPTVKLYPNYNSAIPDTDFFRFTSPASKMLSEGMAWIYDEEKSRKEYPTNSPEESALLNMYEAQLEEKGIWADKEKQMHPREFRKLQSKKAKK